MIELSNKRHEAFCHEYVKHFNGTKAYKSVYPDVKDTTANENSAKLLRNTKVQQRLAEICAVINKENDIETSDIIQGYKNLAYYDISEILDWDGTTLKVKAFEDIPKEARSAILSVKQSEDGYLEVKLEPRKGALDSLSRYKGLFNDRIDIVAKVKTIEDIIREKKDNE